MIAYSQLLRYIKELAEKDDYVNTILARLPEDFDWEKSNLFPIFNISVLSGNFITPSIIRFDVVLTCVDKRDISKDNDEDKFYLNDNEIDNHNGTLTTLHSIWGKMNIDFNSKNITSSENPSFNQIEYAGMNLMDGWTLTFTVDVPTDVCLNGC